MADGITINANGEAEMMFTGQKPWHGLGTELPALATAEQAMAAAHLDWTVEKRPMHFPLKSGKMVPMAKRFVTVRADTEQGLGVCGKDWVPFQNSEAFQFCDALVEEKAAIYETAGSLWGGKRVWMLAKLAGVCRVAGDDIINKYLLLSNSHEGGVAIAVKLTGVRVVCQNTLNMAMADASKLMRVQHSTNTGDRIEEVRTGLGLINLQFEQLREKMARLAEVKVTTTQFEVFAEALGWKPDGERDAQKDDFQKLVKAFETGPGADMPSAKGTLWGAVNAVTFYVDHLGNFHQTQNGTPGDNKLRSIWWGTGDSLKTKALNTALAMAK